jgi:hypothetical protein
MPASALVTSSDSRHQATIRPDRHLDMWLQPASRDVIRACSCRAMALWTMPFTSVAARSTVPARRARRGSLGASTAAARRVRAPLCRRLQEPTAWRAAADGRTRRPSKTRARSSPGPGGGGSNLRRSLANLTNHNIGPLAALVETWLRQLQYWPGFLNDAWPRLASTSNPRY